MNTFRDLEDATARLYEGGDHLGALRLLEEHAPKFRALGHRCKIAFYQACLWSKSGAPDVALDALDAAVNDGLWWSDVMLADADLDACRGERLDRIIARTRPQSAPFACFVDEAHPSKRRLLALHGGGDVVEEFDNPWAPLTVGGWTVHRPISTQRSGAGLATWTEFDTAVGECRRHLDAIGSIDAIGSVSLGGSLALRLVTEVVSVPVIMIAPSLRPAVVSSAVLAAHGTVVDIITGEHDPYLAQTDEAVTQLRDAGADIRLEVVPGLGHDFPPDFEQRLADLAASRGSDTS